MRKVDNLVIGSTLEAAKFCQENEAFLVLTPPPGYTPLEKEIILSRSRILFDLYVKGRVLNHKPSISIEIEDNNLSFFDGYKRKELSFGKAFFFDFIPSVCDGFSVISERFFYRVVDWLSLLSNTRHNLKHIHVGERSFYDLHFFNIKEPSLIRFKGILFFSYLKEEEVDAPEFSHSIARLRALRALEEEGVRAPAIEILKRQKNKITQRIVEAPKDIVYFESFEGEVLNERTKTILSESGIPLGWGSSDSESPI